MNEIDFNDERVKETISKLSAETGMSLTEIMSEIKFYEEHKTYVRFVQGEHKGKVGYLYPSGEVHPYAKEVHIKDYVIWCPRWETELETITKEEYEETIKESSNE